SDRNSRFPLGSWNRFIVGPDAIKTPKSCRHRGMSWKGPPLPHTTAKAPDLPQKMTRRATAMTDTFQLIHHAILKRQQIVAVYLDHTRFLCPHVLGYKNGREQCLFYQFGGTSETDLGPAGSPSNWRCISVAGLSDVRGHDRAWVLFW